jgi:hypothetical protein
VIVNEVATMEYLRLNGIPVPKVYRYSVTAENTAGTESVFMGLARGTNLCDIWFGMSEEARITVIIRTMEVKSRLFSLQFSANGSLCFSEDLKAWSDKVSIPATDFLSDNRLCIGSDTAFSSSYGKRLAFQIDRGPCTYQPCYLHIQMQFY